MAAGEGFEPSHTESESAVLPLHNPAISFALSHHSQAQDLLYQNLAICQACFSNIFYFFVTQHFILFLCIFLLFSGQFVSVFQYKKPPGRRVHPPPDGSLCGSVLLGTAALVLSLVLLLVLGILAVGLILGIHVGFVLLLVLHKAHLAFTGPIIPAVPRKLYEKIPLHTKIFPNSNTTSVPPVLYFLIR